MSFRLPGSRQVWLVFAAVWLWPHALRAADPSALCAERSAIEHIYYTHRLGSKPPFDEVSPPAVIERLVREDLHKEAVLKKVYGVSVTPAQLAAEVQRINATTRAPEMLAEIKAALGPDPALFANAFARPILVDRELRERFANDAALHAATRRECEQARRELLAARTNGATAAGLLALLQRDYSNAVSEVTWQCGARPETKPAAAPPEEAGIKQRFGPNAQIISAPAAGGRPETFYFDELPGALQKVLRAQLRQAGDVSAVIETPGGFLLYLVQARTPETLSVATLALPKRNFEQWLADQRAS